MRHRFCVVLTAVVVVVAKNPSTLSLSYSFHGLATGVFSFAAKTRLLRELSCCLNTNYDFIVAV